MKKEKNREGGGRLGVYRSLADLGGRRSEIRIRGFGHLEASIVQLERKGKSE